MDLGDGESSHARWAHLFGAAAQSELLGYPILFA